MYIKKWPKNKRANYKKYSILSITQKCKYCNTVVGIDSLNDMYYDGYTSFEDIGLFDKLDHQYKFGYICPYCERNQLLSNKNLNYLTKYIDANHIDLYPYEQMDMLKYSDRKHAYAYEIFCGYALSHKYNIQVHASLQDKTVERLFLDHPDIVNKIINEDGSFISGNTFYLLFRKWFFEQTGMKLDQLNHDGVFELDYLFE